MSDLAAAVTAAAEEMRKRSTHTREVTKTDLAEGDRERIAALEKQVADLSQALADAAEKHAKLLVNAFKLDERMTSFVAKVEAVETRQEKLRSDAVALDERISSFSVKLTEVAA